MKSKFYVLTTILLAVILLSSCEKDDLEYQNEFESSLNAWLDFKKSVNNSYKYKAVGGSFDGQSWETTLTVSDGKLIERRYKSVRISGSSQNNQEENLEWVENGTKIGTHKFQGADALTLDEVYELAKTEWLIKRDDAKTFFETKNNGLLSTCGYVKDGCQDDCFYGIEISSIEML